MPIGGSTHAHHPSAQRHSPVRRLQARTIRDTLSTMSSAPDRPQAAPQSRTLANPRRLRASSLPSRPADPRQPDEARKA